MIRRLTVVSALMVFMVGGTAVALAAWLIPSSRADVVIRSGSVPVTGPPTVTSAGSSVTVTWNPVEIEAGRAVEGYRVMRYRGNGPAQTPTGTCADTIATTSCAEGDVPPGAWTYTVRARQGAWAGPESGRSVVVHISESARPTLVVDPGAVPSDPAVAAEQPAPGTSSAAPTTAPAAPAESPGRRTQPTPTRTNPTRQPGPQTPSTSSPATGAPEPAVTPAPSTDGPG